MFSQLSSISLRVTCSDVPSGDKHQHTQGRVFSMYSVENIGKSLETWVDNFGPAFFHANNDYLR